jgi:CheY-like chemotaxis protein
MTYMQKIEPKPAVVAVLNSNEDLVRLVREVLHGEGYLTIAHHIKDLRDGNTDMTRFLEDRDPPVIIFDLAPPFTINWQFFQIFKQHPTMKGRKVILTTNNAAALKQVCGVDALQIVGQDEDLGQLLETIKAAFTERTSPSRPQIVRA